MIAGPAEFVMPQGEGSTAKALAPESIRSRICELLKEVTRKGYHGSFTVTVNVRDGQIYGFDKELRETDRAR